jgi:hypothetical protein
MSRLPIDCLDPVDRELRLLKPVTMLEGTKLYIELINGFELFNTTQYHNYETFSDGWRITDGKIAVEGEDLLDAVRAFREKFLKEKDNPPVLVSVTIGDTTIKDMEIEEARLLARILRKNNAQCEFGKRQ